MIGRPRSVRVRMGFVLAISMMGAAGTGCGGGDFVPPPPGPRESDDSGERVPSPVSKVAKITPFATEGAGTVRRIDYIQSGRVDPIEAEMEANSARMQAGYDRARLHILPADEAGGPAGSSGAAPRSQADWIRRSIAEKASAIILEPDDPADKELASAVRAARTARVPVVVVGRPLAGAGQSTAPGAAPMILVAPRPFDSSARRLVELSIRNVKNAKLDPTGGAIILVSEIADRLASDRAAAIREALKAAGVAAVAELRIPIDTTAGVSILKKRLQDDPKAVMVFFLEANGVAISKETVNQIGERRPFVQAGYSADEARMRMVRAGEYAAIAEYDPTRLIRRAVTVAAAAAQGRESREKEELSIDVLESPIGAGTPRAPVIRSSTPELRPGQDPKPR